MTTVVKENNKLMVPESIQRRAGIKTGDHLEFKVSGGIINIIPKLPSADDEYTPEQRRIIDARLNKADEDIKAGRMHGPFASAKEACVYIERRAKERAGGKKLKRSPR